MNIVSEYEWWWSEGLLMHLSAIEILSVYTVVAYHQELSEFKQSFVEFFVTRFVTHVNEHI